MPAKTARAPKKTKTPAPRMTLAEAMSALEKAGSAQTRKTYMRHGGTEPMFGVSFAFLKTLVKRIGVDQDLALALWDTGNFDARLLAVKIADPARMTPTALERWASAPSIRMCGSYMASLVAEGPHARAKADSWLAAPSGSTRCVAWGVVGMMAMLDTETPDSWFAERLATIAATIHSAPNAEREPMLQALISIGCRSPGLRKACEAAAKKIGKVEIDHGDTACKTRDPREYIAKAWTHSTSKGFKTPAEHERSRESMRTRC